MTSELLFDLLNVAKTTLLIYLLIDKYRNYRKNKRIDKRLEVIQHKIDVAIADLDKASALDKRVVPVLNKEIRNARCGR